MPTRALSCSPTIASAASACLWLFASIAALALAPASAAPASVAARTVATRRCETSGLDIWFNNEGGGGTAGSIYYKLQLTNLSGHACALSGYPGVSAVDLSGRQIGRVARREAFQTPHTVTLATGASATAVLRITEAGNYSASLCHEVTAAGLRVYPPGQTSSKLVPFPFQACSGTGPAVLSVRAFQQ